jgi:hypothetical protein
VSPGQTVRTTPTWASRTSPEPTAPASPDEGDDGAGSDDNGGGDQQPELKRPRKNGARQAWADYAVALGACTAEEAAGLSREQLIDLCVPQEEKPSDPAV